MRVQEFNPEGTTGLHPFGMFYRSDLAGISGARYELLKEVQHTTQDIEKAKFYLYQNFDCVSIRIIKETNHKSL